MHSTSRCHARHSKKQQSLAANHIVGLVPSVCYRGVVVCHSACQDTRFDQVPIDTRKRTGQLHLHHMAQHSSMKPSRAIVSLPRGTKKRYNARSRRLPQTGGGIPKVGFWAVEYLRTTAVSLLIAYGNILLTAASRRSSRRALLLLAVQVHMVVYIAAFQHPQLAILHHANTFQPHHHFFRPANSNLLGLLGLETRFCESPYPDQRPSLVVARSQ